MIRGCLIIPLYSFIVWLEISELLAKFQLILDKIYASIVSIYICRYVMYNYSVAQVKDLKSKCKLQ